MTKATLFALLSSSTPPRCTINGIRGILKSVEREDGSGKPVTVFVRCEE